MHKNDIADLESLICLLRAEILNPSLGYNFAHQGKVLIIYLLDIETSVRTNGRT